MNNEKIQEITVTIGNQNIKSTLLNNNGSDLEKDDRDTFKFAFKENALSDIKYINIGDKVTLDFGNNAPDNITIKDNILNSKGERIYTDKEIIDVPYANENNKYSFTIDIHKASFLSSYYVENKTDFRGFLVSAFYDKKEYDYAFVIKTDAAHPNTQTK